MSCIMHLFTTGMSKKLTVPRQDRRCCFSQQVAGLAKVGLAACALKLLLLLVLVLVFSIVVPVVFLLLLLLFFFSLFRLLFAIVFLIA